MNSIKPFQKLLFSKNYSLIWLFLISVSISSCQEHPTEASIHGVWAISNFTANGFDQTELVNQDFTKWIEFSEDNQFRSGSMKVDHTGKWTYNSKTGILKFTSKAEAWGNTTWKVQGHSSNMHFKRIDVAPTPLTSILFTRMEKVPTITKYVRNELDEFTGLWQVDSLKADGVVNKNLQSRWIRLRRIGVLESGDNSGVLFQANFTYDAETNTLITEHPTNGNSDKWQIEWNNSHKTLVFATPETNSKMYMSMVEEFVED